VSAPCPRRGERPGQLGQVDLVEQLGQLGPLVVGELTEVDDRLQRVAGDDPAAACELHPPFGLSHRAPPLQVQAEAPGRGRRGTDRRVRAIPALRRALGSL